MADQTTETTKKNKKGKSLWVKILLILVILVIGGIIGYSIGKSHAEDEAQANLQQQVSSLQQQLDLAKKGVNNEVQEGQQSLESLQTENATLKSTIEKQNQKIADLEKQLEEAQSTNPPSDGNQ